MWFTFSFLSVLGFKLWAMPLALFAFTYFSYRIFLFKASLRLWSSYLILLLSWNSRYELQHPNLWFTFFVVVNAINISFFFLKKVESSFRKKEENFMFLNRNLHIILMHKYPGVAMLSLTALTAYGSLLVDNTSYTWSNSWISNLLPPSMLQKCAQNIVERIAYRICISIASLNVPNWVNPDEQNTVSVATLNGFGFLYSSLSWMALCFMMPAICTKGK
jgi:hypothetical protein